MHEPVTEDAVDDPPDFNVRINDVRRGALTHIVGRSFNRRRASQRAHRRKWQEGPGWQHIRPRWWRGRWRTMRDRGFYRPLRWRSRPVVRTLELVSVVGTILLGLWLARALYVLVSGGSSSFPLGFNPDRGCKDVGVSCNGVSGLAVAWLSLAASYAAFLFYRRRVVVGGYRRRAIDEPDHLVPTVGSMVSEDHLNVVGRDELCEVIIDSLHIDEDRRPHVLIGGVGTGKTAVLVLLTRRLAELGAVPIPLRLRDAEHDIDFHELACRRFHAEVDARLLSNGEGDKLWRHLRKDDRVVVIADSLEEALSEGDEERDRDNLIRIAIHRARADHLPLVIASRPHNPLRGMEAGILGLEPLSEEAALEYLEQGGLEDDRQRLDWIVETADIAEMPFYLWITRELSRADRLQHLESGQGEGTLDTRGLDRSALRLSLLDTWMTALIQGRLGPQLPLTQDEREVTLAFVSALACIGLKQDRLEVKYEDLVDMGRPTQEVFKHQCLGKQVENSLERLGNRRIDIRLAATWATQLRLVEARGNRVWFPHSILQAYLGSRLMDSALADPTFEEDALRMPDRPGREFLISLVLLSRRDCRTSRGPTPDGVSAASIVLPDRITGTESVTRTGSMVDCLIRAAAKRDDSKALDIYAAALEIDSVEQPSKHCDIASIVVDRWVHFCASDQNTLDEAKLGLVHRLGEAVREVERQYQRRGEDPTSITGEAYRNLYELGYKEAGSYAVRHAVAQEIGAGGSAAFAALHAEMQEALTRLKDWRDGAESADAEKEETGQRRFTDEDWRKSMMCAWLAPLLLGSIREGKYLARAEQNLRRWVGHVGHHEEPAGPFRLPLSIETPLAQGFKYAANRQRRHPYVRHEAGTFLSEQATELLKRTGFWFSQMTLIHALCLWTLPDDLTVRRGTEGPIETSRVGDESGSEARVAHWLTIAGCHQVQNQSTEEAHASAQQTHPFVGKAANLARLALLTGRPELYIWIDESGIVSRVGSRTVRGRKHRKHNLWIPPSVGWTALDPRAQRLVADVLLLVNLAERGESLLEREQRLERVNRTDLPPCLLRDSTPLAPDLTLGRALTSEPGTNCSAGCAFELCPYPPKGVTQPSRAEFSEVFCLRQQSLLSLTRLRRRATLGKEPLPQNISQLWAKMAARARL